MEKFTHGIIAINPNKPNDEDSFDVLHFVGYWLQPDEDDVLSLWKELAEDEELGLKDEINDIELIPAPQDIVDYYNLLVASGEIPDKE